MHNAASVFKVHLDENVVIMQDGESIPIVNKFGLHGDEVKDNEHVTSVVTGPTLDQMWVATTVNAFDRAW